MLEGERESSLLRGYVSTIWGTPIWLRLQGSMKNRLYTPKELRLMAGGRLPKKDHEGLFESTRVHEGLAYREPTCPEPRLLWSIREESQGSY